MVHDAGTQAYITTASLVGHVSGVKSTARKGHGALRSDGLAAADGLKRRRFSDGLTRVTV